MSKRIIWPILLILVWGGYSLGFLKVNDYKWGLNNEINMIKQVFPQNKFQQKGDRFIDEEGRTFYVYMKVIGSFVKAGRDELLLIVKRPKSELSHVDGYFNAYVAVFDDNAILCTNPLQLYADSAQINFVKINGISYMLFNGIATFQGMTSYHSRLWKAGEKWVQIWPKEESGDLTAEVEDDKINVFQYVYNPNIKMPEERYLYTLQWDNSKGIFVEKK